MRHRPSSWKPAALEAAAPVAPVWRAHARALVERFGYGAFLFLNAAAVFGAWHTGALSEGSVLLIHVVNIAVLAALELLSPQNPRWLLVREGRVRWALLAKTYLWYLWDSRVWFRLHGVVFVAIGAFLARRLSLFDAAVLPPLVQLVGFALLTDLARYWIHRACHARPFLWRFHAMHHTPTNMTPVRAWWTHPVDDVLLYGLEIVLMGVLRLDPLVILAYVSLDNSFQLLNHANIRLKTGLLGLVFQSPRTHLLHHARTGEGERAANFGEMFTLFDRLFGTLETRAPDEMTDLEIGIAPKRHRTLWHQLTAPFWRASHEL